MSEPVRSADEPFAFSRDEWLFGAFQSWLAFVVLACAAMVAWSVFPSLPTRFDGLAWVPMIVAMTAIIGGTVSFAVMLIGLPVAYALGRALRRTTSTAVHLTTYAGLGAAIGTLALGVFWLAVGAPWPALAVTTIAVTTASTTWGWWRASRGARRAPGGTTGVPA